MRQDWLKIHRKIVGSAVFADAELLKLWILCLIKANWQDCTVFWERLKTPIHLKRGQFVTSRQALFVEFYPKRHVQPKSARSVWRWLHVLQNLDNLRIESVQVYSVVTIVNYDTYQDTSADDVQPSVQLVSNSCPTHVQPRGSGVSNSDKSLRRRSLSLSLEEGEEGLEETHYRLTADGPAKPPCGTKDEYFAIWWKVYPRKVGKKAARASWNRAIKTIAVERNCLVGLAVKDLQEAVEAFAASTLGKDPQFCPHPTTWLNAGRYDDDRAEWDRTSEGDKPASPTVDVAARLAEGAAMKAREEAEK